MPVNQKQLQRMLLECAEALKHELVATIQYDDYYYARRYISALEGLRKASLALGDDREKEGKPTAKFRADNKKAVARRA